jgi:hypothetical protein
MQSNNTEVFVLRRASCSADFISAHTGRNRGSTGLSRDFHAQCRRNYAKFAVSNRAAGLRTIPVESRLWVHWTAAPLRRNRALLLEQ